MSHVCDGRDLSCLRCAGVASRLEAVRAAMTIDDQLDDIKRARIWAQLEDKLGDPVPRRPRWPVAIGVAAVAAAAAAAMMSVTPRPSRTAAPPRLLSAATDTTVSSRLGPYTQAALVGPAQLELIGPSGDATTVRLRSGTLLAEFAGGANRALRIEAPGAVVEVVGTLFAVEVRDTATCTSVAHGRVRVTSTASVVHVARGERYCTGDAVRPIASEMREALEHHQAAIAVRAKPSGPSPASDPAVLSGVTDSPAPRDPAAVAVDPAAVAHDPAAAARSPAPRDPAAVEHRPAMRDPRSASAPPIAVSSSASQQATPRSAAPDQPLATAGGSRPASPRDTVPTHRPPVAATGAPGPGNAAPPTADELYRAAETSLAARNPAAADRALATLIAEHPGSPLVDQALYERARIAYQQHAWATARRHLDQLAAMPSSPLGEPGHYLTCRIAVEARDGEAATCLADYRRTFPRSPHDLDALALLVQLAHARAGCPAATALIAELVRTYPRTTLAAAWRTRCPEPR